MVDVQSEIQWFLEAFQSDLNSFSDILLNDYHFAMAELEHLRNQLQQVREEELELKNNLTSVLANFEEKAGKGMALNGLFRNNSELKHEIMQKRTKVDRRCLALMEKTNTLFQKVDQLSSMIQEQSERHSKNTAAIEAEIDKLRTHLKASAQITDGQIDGTNWCSYPELNQPLEDMIVHTMNTLDYIQRSQHLTEKNT